MLELRLYRNPKTHVQIDANLPRSIQRRKRSIEAESQVRSVAVSRMRHPGNVDPANDSTDVRFGIVKEFKAAFAIGAENASSIKVGKPYSVAISKREEVHQAQSIGRTLPITWRREIG